MDKHQQRKLNLERVNDLIQDELKRRGLPAEAFIDNSKGIYGDAPVVRIVRGERGSYYLTRTSHSAKELNDSLGVTPAQVEAMKFGSMFGWDTPSAWPQMYEGEDL